MSEPYFSNGIADLYHGDTRDVLAELPERSVQAVVTSPPYWGLRDYSIEPVIWGDGWRGSLGLEPTPDMFVEHIVEVFRAVRRVLRDDAVAWVNLGDSYAASGMSEGGSEKQRSNAGSNIGEPRKPPAGLKALDLVNIPHRVAAALQADGWYWRSTVVWAKPNPMPESVSGWRWERCQEKVSGTSAKNSGGIRGMNIQSGWTKETHPETRTPATYDPCPGCPKCAPNDGLVLRRGSWRPTSSYEYIFLMAKTADYFADGEAVREASITNDPRKPYGSDGAWAMDGRNKWETGAGQEQQRDASKRNLRNVWNIATAAFPGAHFATFPPALVERCILASTPAQSCSECGAPWASVVEGGFTDHDGETDTTYDAGMTAGRLARMRQAARAKGGEYQNERKVTGHRPTCQHEADPVAPVICDPFAGSCTTNLVAQQLGRRSVGIDAKEEYLDMGIKRLEAVSLPMVLA